jgi:hypothetical protein
MCSLVTGGARATIDRDVAQSCRGGGAQWPVEQQRLKMVQGSSDPPEGWL